MRGSAPGEQKIRGRIASKIRIIKWGGTMTGRKSICAAILFGLAFMLNAQDIPWEQLRAGYDDPNNKALTDYAIIDNVPMVKAGVANIPAEYFAIASLLRFFEDHGYVQFPFLNAPKALPPNMDHLWYELLGSPNREKEERIAQLKRYLDSFGKKAHDLANKAGILHPTEGQLLAILLNKTAPDADAALQKILYAHFYQAKPLRIIHADMQVAKVLLNIGIPFVFREKEQLSICVGYWEDNTGVKFITCRLAQANPVTISKKEFSFLRRRISRPYRPGPEDDNVMVEDDWNFSLNNKPSLALCRAIAFPDNAEMLIVNKPGFNEDILKAFLRREIAAGVEKK